MKINQLYFIFLFGLWGFFIADAFTKITTFYNIGITGAALKLLIFMYLLMYNIKNYNKNHLVLLLGVSFLFLIFIFNQTLLLNNLDNFVYNLGYFIKYIYIFFIFTISRELFFNTILLNKLLINFKIIILINSFLILLGIIFNISLFETYALNNQIYVIYRFGYDGLLNSQADAVFIYSLSITYLYYSRKSKLDDYVFYFILLISFFIGTKSMYLFLIFFFSHVFFYKVRNKFSLFKSLILILFLCFIFVLLDANITEIFLKTFSYIIYMIENKGLVYTLLSGRNEFFETRFLFSIENNPLILLFGGQDAYTSLVELQLIDLVYFFGVLGSIIYISVYISLIGTTFFKYTKNLVLVISLLVISLFSGHFFDNNAIVFMLALVISYMKSITYINGETR